jgi:hypothetical protein
MPFFFPLDAKKTLVTRILVTLLIGILPVGAARAYTPESPEVREAVKQAAAFLMGPDSTAQSAGARALIALALYKAGIEPSDAKIKEGIGAARNWAESSAEDQGGHDTYVPALCFMLLAEADPLESRPQLELLLNSILARQRPNGCWTYRPPRYDDTSQSQYGLLCLWAAYQMGMEIPVEAVEQAAIWHVRTQYSGGGWSYRPPLNLDPTPVTDSRHTQITHSMSVAGAGSLYVCYHLLGFAPEEQETDSNLPPALTKVVAEEQQGRSLRPQTVTRASLAPAISSANGWFANNLNFETKWWTHYYMYGLERYMSFRELVERKPEKEPDWYKQGVEFLRRTQRSDGSWQSEQAPTSGPIIDTSFAILFLTRSSRSMIQRAVLESDILIGGHGLPKNLTNIRLEDGKVVAPQMVRDVDDLLDLLKDTEDKEFDARALPGGLSLDEDLTKRTSQLERLRELITDEDFHARFAAVKTLARSDDLDNVPALIYALTDGDGRIVHEANNGLRFISRKFMAHPLPPDPAIEQKWGVQAKWKAWFLSIRPDAEFLD